MTARPGVLVVIGTRPEAIKLAPVVSALRRRDDRLTVRLALTGQHTSLVDQVLETFALRPDYDLGIMREGQNLYDVAHGCLDGLRAVVAELRPQVVVVQGDTATVFFGALVAFFEGMRVGHVEAGLRSGNKWAPYPEEIFRRLADVISDFHFAPTREARDHLLREGTDPSSIYVTGNTVVDALLAIGADTARPADAALRGALDSGRRLVLLTAHRRESFGAPLKELFAAIRELADAFSDIEIVYPVHPNPQVKEPAYQQLSGHARIHLTEPLTYRDLMKALQSAVLVLTDSGGIQEEAPTFGTPVLVLRAVTERPEGIRAGVARLVGTDRVRILEQAGRLLGNEAERLTMARAANPYGDGRAGERIADVLVSALCGGPRQFRDWEGVPGG
ncbi:MAG: UDP-N-acetylglucosamine 2-epimerase (non-hydrolyzing) [Gemmatimonadetes bacterium]|nr:UDP-N-acetylglucosamine 2-epimerase (non-hydrolyzing) [Gemmatimonadota bacterium]